jgi:hydrophobe/amphiphile efflux-1 (HAE1) family protein
MKFTELFIRKPVLSLVISLLILLVGIKSFFLLPVSQYPLISPSVITVTTSYPGAPSELMEGFVTTPLENALGGIQGIDVIHSKSKQGSSQITLQFKLGYDLTKAMSDVSNAVASVRKQLPKEVLDPVIDSKDPNADPTLFISFTSKTMTPAAISDYLSRVIQPQLQNVAGVSQAQIFSSDMYAMRLWLDPQKMAAHHVTASDIINALNQNNVQAAPGSLRTPWETIKIDANTDMTTAEQFNNLVIQNKNNYLVRLSDVGHAVLGVQSDQMDAAVQGNHQAIIMGIIPLPMANPLTVANAVKALLPQLQANLPNDIKIHLVWDYSKFIVESINDVKRTFFEACLFVFVVIFLFLGTLRATLIPLITIPLSIIGVCTAMLVLGYTLNILTLLAWILAIGLVVDDAIVVLENIHRHIEQGLSPFKASLIGAKEIGFAIVAMTLTLAAVYAPIGFINDMTGILFREFAFTLAASVVISGFVALTLSPMMCSKLLHHSTKPWAFIVKIESLLNRLTLAYKQALTWTLKRRKLVLASAVIIYLACFALFKSLASELAPAEDQGVIITSATGPTSANLLYMKKYMAQIEAIYKTIPEVATYITITGMPSLNGGLSFLILKPWDERQASSQAIIQSLFKRFWAIAGIQAFPFNPPALPGSTGHAPLIMVLKSTDSYLTLSKLAKKLQIAVAQDNPRILGLRSDLNMDMKQVDIHINKDKAIASGISMGDIANSLNILIGEPQSSVFNWNGRSYQVIPQLYRNYMSASEQLKDLYVRSQSGKLIPLANVISLHNTVSAQSLNHFQQLRAVTLSANLAPGYTIGEAVNYLQQLTKKILPSTVQIDFDGETRQFIQAGNSMEQTFLFALLFIFLVLAAQFESFRAPFIILLTVPLSITGALFTLHLTGGTLNIYTQIGLVTLIGLITKHGILIVEFANQLRKKQTLLLNDAVIEAASLRLRPILMTTAAMLLAAVPLALAKGVGAHARSQLGWVIFGGMAIGTFFTLFILPVMYTLVYAKKSSVTDSLAEEKQELLDSTQ